MVQKPGEASSLTTCSPCADAHAKDVGKLSKGTLPKQRTLARDGSVCLVPWTLGLPTSSSLASLNPLLSAHPTDWTPEHYFKPHRPGSLPLHSGRSRIQLYIRDRLGKAWRDGLQFSGATVLPTLRLRAWPLAPLGGCLSLIARPVPSVMCPESSSWYSIHRTVPYGSWSTQKSLLP